MRMDKEIHKNMAQTLEMIISGHLRFQTATKQSDRKIFFRYHTPHLLTTLPTTRNNQLGKRWVIIRTPAPTTSQSLQFHHEDDSDGNYDGKKAKTRHRPPHAGDSHGRAGPRWCARKVVGAWASLWEDYNTEAVCSLTRRPPSVGTAWGFLSPGACPFP